MSDLSSFDYTLPPELIAQQPLARRADARLLVVDRGTGEIDHRHVRDLPYILRVGDALVTNNTRVVPARVVGIRTETGGHWEGLFLSTDEQGNWRMLCKTRGRLRPPETVTLLDRHRNEDIKLWLIERDYSGVWLAHPATDSLGNSEPAYTILDRVGRVPLPPYIRAGEMSQSDTINYQTVFAKHPGAVAAPTAGLHFTPDLLGKLRANGISEHEVTLHVGLDTFRPIAVENLDEHKMHSEWGEIAAETARALNEQRQAKGRIIAVGTTTVRVLESASRDHAGGLTGWSGSTSLFIRPPYQFHSVDALMTNFHLPRTTLLILVSTFAGTDLIRRAYDEAIKERYRFYSYGDAMLIV